MKTENTETKLKEREKRTPVHRGLSIVLKSLYACLVFVFTACTILVFLVAMTADQGSFWAYMLGPEGTLLLSILLFSILTLSALIAYFVAFKIPKIPGWLGVLD